MGDGVSRVRVVFPRGVSLNRSTEFVCRCVSSFRDRSLVFFVSGVACGCRVVRNDLSRGVVSGC